MRGSAQFRRRLAGTAALGAAVLLLPAMSPAEAADPSSGTVSDSSTAVTWSSGPFAVANPTGDAGAPACNAVTVCDDYALHVSTPPGYGGGHQLAISIQWANTAADFDLYVLDSAGTVVGTSASSADPELVLLPPDTGDYTVRVVPYLPLGESFTGKAELTTTPANPSPADIAAPAFGTYAAPESLAARTTPGSRRSASTPPPVRSCTSPTCPPTGSVRRRERRRPGPTAARTPPTAARSTTSRASTRSCTPTGRPAALRVAARRQGRAHLLHRRRRPDLEHHDRLGIPAGSTTRRRRRPDRDDPLVGPVSDYPHAVYYCSQDIADARCAASRGRRRSYGPAVPIYDLTQCGGLHGHVKVDPSSGIAYLPNKGCGGGQAVAVFRGQRPVVGRPAGHRLHPG